MKRIGLIGAVLFCGTVVAANWTLATFGVVYGVPTGVLWIGLAFTLRDVVQEALGRWVVLALVLLGAALSYAVSPAFALASAAAFAVSELCDFAVYTPLRERNWLGAVALSGLVGLVVDSVVFLRLAFGNLDYLPGQVLGKAAVLGLTVALLSVGRRRAVLARHA